MLKAAVTGAFLVVALGLLAPWISVFDGLNNLLPMVLLGAMGLAIVAATMGRRAIASANLLLAVLLVPLIFLPLTNTAPRAVAPVFLRLVTFNLWAYNERFADVAEFLLKTDADVILLQEVRCGRAEPLLTRLRAKYPHVLHRDEPCFDLALLSKQPWLESGHVQDRTRHPLLVWAKFQRGGVTFQITGTQVSNPIFPVGQARHIETLVAHASKIKGPQIIAGDFNHTPFTWRFARLTGEAGLRPHATFLATWPSLLPIFPIDHVLSSREFARVRIARGPHLGSDHRPVIADIALAR